MKVKVSKDQVLRYTMTIILVLMLFIVEGCFDFVTLEFHIEKVLDGAFWVNAIFYAVILIIIRSIALLSFMPVARVKNKDLFKAESKNKRLMAFKDNNFPRWVENVKNPEIKIEAWKIKVNKKLVKLEKKSKLRDRSIWNDDSISQELKNINKYCKKKQDLLNQLNDEWIKENLNYLPIKKYVRINAAIFDVPVNISDKKSIYQLQSKERLAIIGLLSFTAIWLIVWRAIQQVVEYAQNDTLLIAIIIELLLDLGFMIYQFVSGITNAYKLVNDEEVLPYTNRNRILVEYIYDKNENNKESVKTMLYNIDKEIENEINGA